MINALRKSFCVCLILIIMCVAAQTVFASQKVNINTATVAELVVLKGVGEKTAVNIVEYRKINGDFRQIADITNVKGVGEKTFIKIADQITVDEESAK